MHDPKIQDCQIVGIQCEAIEVIHCVFQNVIFKSSFMRTMVFVENGEFLNCEFADTYEKTAFMMGDSMLKNCIFEGIKIHNSTGLQLLFSNNQLYECKFKNIKIDAGIKIAGNKMQGGSLGNFWCCS